MRRAWFGVGLLVLLLTAGILAGFSMEWGLGGDAENLRRAGELALAGNWEQANALTDAVRKDWDHLQWLTSSLFRHDILEQIEAVFAQLAPYAAGEDGVAYSALCTTLAEQIEALGMAHGCSWLNFF